MNNTDRKNKMSDKKPNTGKLKMIIVSLAFAFIFTSLSSLAFDSLTKRDIEITYNEFITLLENNKVESVVFDSGKIIVTPIEANEKSFVKVTYWTTELNDPELINDLKERYRNIDFKGEQEDTRAGFFWMIIQLLRCQ